MTDKRLHFTKANNATDCAGLPSVHLTFDDGPDSVWTPHLLDVLAQHNVPATFCVIGRYATEHPHLIRRIIADGHEIANHTMTHPDLSRCEPANVASEIAQASRVITSVCPEARLRHIRAPYGLWTEHVLSCASRAGLAALHWSVDPRDWSRPGVDAIVNAVLHSIQPSSIVLLHDGCPPDERKWHCDLSVRDQTVSAVSRLIPALLNRGFAIRPIPHIH
ncbi:chitooligosaccharide deacetylase NodB [Bradyrhizobium sp. DOA9]|uniref:chitooligosaccharide deacetylase NodB n=1 Tax=Bradyrhizobium sp. DOA9 TaxID=1126627 RepID=UPI00049993FD|nr:chitooligosaccharide deacetylase NodB [Bradyrhizobium sp. DOA9]GAJ37733.1 chitooligosaccharide deacetylase [Bradyrhizobium sp. DOA9]